MQTSLLGDSTLRITRIGFGTWAIGGPGWSAGWGDQDDNESVRAIHRALEHGINWIDTAAVYGLGHAEEVVARALHEWQGARPLVFTKCGQVWDAAGSVSKLLDGASIRRECEASLRRLKVDTIDLYQIHKPTDRIEDIDEAWTTIAELKEEGKIRWAGVSNFDVEQMERARAIAPITSLQPPYSLLRRGVEEEILPYCLTHNIGVIIYAPMYSGLLTGAMTRERLARMGNDDWRSSGREFREPRLTRNLEFVERLRTIGAPSGRSPGELAIAWTLRHPAVTAAIVGGRSAEQVNGVVGALDVDPELVAAL